MTITNFRVETSMGKVSTYFGHPLPFLTEDERAELDTIGYTGKNSNGEQTNRVAYLNSLGKGQFEVSKIKHDNGDFSEVYMITRVTQ